MAFLSSRKTNTGYEVYNGTTYSSGKTHDPKRAWRDFEEFTKKRKVKKFKKR